MLEQSINFLKDIINFIHIKMLNILLYLLDIFRSNSSGFFQFLFERNIMLTAVGFIVSTQITKLISSFIEIFVNPIIKRFSAGTVESLKDIEIEIFSINIKIGLFIDTLFSFMITFLIVYQIFAISKNQDLSGLINWLRNSEEAIVSSKSKIVIAVTASK